MLEVVAILLWLTSLRQRATSQTACFRRRQVDRQTETSGTTAQVYYIRQKVSALAASVWDPVTRSECVCLVLVDEAAHTQPGARVGAYSRKPHGDSIALRAPLFASV